MVVRCLEQVNEPLGYVIWAQSPNQGIGVDALGNEDVRGLDVTMHDASGVSGIQSVGNLDG
jgi:hypothetical protein